MPRLLFFVTTKVAAQCIKYKFQIRPVYAAQMIDIFHCRRSLPFLDVLAIDGNIHADELAQAGDFIGASDTNEVFRARTVMGESVGIRFVTILTFLPTSEPK